MSFIALLRDQNLSLTLSGRKSARNIADRPSTQGMLSCLLIAPARSSCRSACVSESRCQASKNSDLQAVWIPLNLPVTCALVNFHKGIHGQVHRTGFYITCQ
jgi:hypothetical protein